MPEDDRSPQSDRIKNALGILAAVTGLITWFLGDLPRVVRLVILAMAAGIAILVLWRPRFRILYALAPILLLTALILAPPTRAWILPVEPPPDAEEPLAVAVIADPGTWLQSTAYDVWWLFPETGGPAPSELPPGTGSLDNELAFHQWAADHGAIHAHHGMFRIVLRGTSPDAVLVTGLRVHILERSDPMSGWFTGSGACGAVLVRSAGIDLDATPPHVVFSGTDERDPERPANSLTLELRQGQPPEVIEVFASTERYRVTWYADLIYQVEGDRQRSIRIDNEGKPFQVTAVTEESRAYSKVFTSEGELMLQREPSQDGQTGVC